MLHIVPESLDWTAMSDMGDEDLGVQTPEDAELFRRIRDVLVRYDLLDTFGIYLVHKHFPIGLDEEMVEEVDFASETMWVRPVTRSALRMSSMIPTNWFFPDARDGDEMRVHVAQWGHSAHLENAERDPLAARHAPAFREIRAALEDARSLGRFGMFLRRHQFTDETEGNQLECTDQPGRTLTITAEGKQDAPGGSVPTNWVFTPDETVASSCCRCAKNSQGYHRGTHESH